MEPIEPHAITIKQTCGFASLGRTKVNELIAAGKIESFRVGRRRLVRLASLRRFLEEQQ